MVIRAQHETPLGPKQLSALQLSRRIGPLLPHIARQGLNTDDPKMQQALGRAIEKLYKEQNDAASS